jgi:hypothetical protein
MPPVFFDRNKAIKRATPFLNPGEAVAHVIRALEGPNRFIGMGLALLVGFGVSLLLRVPYLALPIFLLLYTRIYARRLILATDEGVVVMAGGRGPRFFSFMPTAVLDRLPLETAIGPLKGLWLETTLNGRRMFIVARSAKDVMAADADLGD